MEFRQLELFLTAAQHGSLRAAAEAIDISQPALTKSVQRLEAALGVKLFERHARGVRLTLFGEALMLHAESLQAELRHTAATMRALRSTASGLVRLGAGPSMASTLLPRVTEALMMTGQAIRLHVQSGLNDSLLTALQNGELDFAITTMPKSTISGLVHQRLFTDQVVVVARHGHPLVSAATLGDLADGKWIMPNRNVLTRVRLTEMFHENCLEGPDISIETDSIPYLLEMVARTDLLSFVPIELLQRGRLAIVPVRHAKWRRTVGVSYWRRHTPTPAERVFLTVLQDVVRTLQDT